MTRHLSIEWPDPAPFKDRGGEPIRILAVSDQIDPALDDVRSRRVLGRIDLIVGCGDLDCDELSFLADAFNAPLVYVLGNHDDERRWKECRGSCPEAMGASTIHKELGLAFMGLSWPGRRGRLANRTESGAWMQAVKLALRRFGRTSPVILLSHVPPRDAGDIPTDAYHRGFAGYAWLLNYVAPPLWLHGHTPLASTSEWLIRRASTTLVNVTGAVLVEVWAPGSGKSKTETPATGIRLGGSNLQATEGPGAAETGRAAGGEGGAGAGAPARGVPDAGEPKSGEPESGEPAEPVGASKASSASTAPSTSTAGSSPELAGIGGPATASGSRRRVTAGRSDRRRERAKKAAEES